MKLVVGLGNPGREYQQTRHNVGFEIVDEIQRRQGLGKPKKKFKGKLNEAAIGGQKVLLLQPETYMNLSGSSVQLVCGFYQIERSDVLVVCDDFNLTLGQLRFRPSGSAGGQKGLADIIRRLGGEDIPRLRIGIGQPPDGWDVADYVLSRFRDDEMQVTKQALSRAALGVLDWVERGMQHCMNQYNTRLSAGQRKQAKTPDQIETEDKE
jgi:PTH1 family peptidyl-tRNA hydrolase